jgi:hypothetical protein
MFLDIGIGILLSLFFGHIFGIGISWFWLFFAIVFVLFPDIDIIFYGIKKIFSKGNIYNHRSFTHYPIVYIPIALLIYFFLGPFYCTLFLCCICFHFIHDSFWLGWGIVWLWPFSTTRFKFFSDKDGKVSSQVLMIWTKQEESQVFQKYHNPHWIRDFYFRPNIVAYIEYSIFIFSLIMLYLIPK